MVIPPFSLMVMIVTVIFVGLHPISSFLITLTYSTTQKILESTLLTARMRLLFL